MRKRVRKRLRELAYFNPALHLELMCERIHEPRGVACWIDQLALDNGVAAPSEVFVTRALRNDVWVEVALAWANEDCGASDVRSFVGQNLTPGGGSHERGFWSGLLSAVLAARPSASVSRARYRRLQRRLEPGLLAVVHVALNDARFAGPTRDRLESDAARAAVHGQVFEAFGAFLAARPALTRRLLGQLEQSPQSRS